jgi:predicted phage tail protein
MQDWSLNQDWWISGSKKGGGAETPTEDPDTLRSRAEANILAAVCEGPVEGFATGSAGSSVFLNDTPINDIQGNSNFGGNVAIAFRNGTQDQSALEGYSDVRVEQSVGAKVENRAGPTSITTTSSSLNRIVVRIGVGALYRVQDDGDVKGTSVNFTITILDRNGSPIVNEGRSISGKSRGPVDFEYFYGLTGEGPWSVRVRRDTADPTNIRQVDDLYFKAVVGIIDQSLRYPNTALIGVKLRAEGFNSIPTISIALKGMKIKVPTNYDPTTATYSGIWDGSFKTVYSNNPAWVFYDLLINTRYGCGDFLSASDIDKFTLYEIGRYCDEQVSNGRGGTERRFTFNGYINNRGEAYEVLNALAATFRGMLYYSNGTIVATQDKPGRVIKIFDASNVVQEVDDSGRVTTPPFVYEGTGRKARKTVALVSWNDPEDKYKTKIEYVEDREAIDRYGYREMEVRGFGCTSQSQAQRIGRWMLVTNLTEKETVTFKTSAQGLFLLPGEIIEIADVDRVGGIAAGIVASGATTTTVPLDREVTLLPGITYRLQTIVNDSSVLYSGTTAQQLEEANEGRDVTTAAGTHTSLSVSPVYTNPPSMGEAWFLRTTELVRKRYRITGLTEENNVVTVLATAYNPDKYAVVDETTALDTQLRSVASLRVTPTVLPSSIVLDVG